jgi:endoglucanase
LRTRATALSVLAAVALAAEVVGILAYLILRQPDVTRPEPTLLTASSENPFSGEKLYVDPQGDAVATVRKWEANGRYEDAQQLKKISESPAPVRYFSEWTEQHDGIKFYVRHFAREWHADGSLPVFGAYAIPKKDCGSYSGGGFRTPAEYKAWIDGFARGIGNKKVIVLLEPDALAGGSCLTDAQRAERYSLLKYAVYTLKARPNAHVYIDAGNSGWQTEDTMIYRLKKAGIERADGFALNTASFNRTSDEIGYGTRISQGVGGKHFIIDTSRNGLGPYTGGTHDGGCPEWLNPPGRALGERPTANTGNSLVDAFYWLKQPGDSDADCDGFPRAGRFVPEYALGLAERAAWGL